MGEKPDGKTLDRIDNNGPYSPENCRWATPAEQSRNQRTSVHLEFNGERMTVEEWGRKIGRDPETIRRRIRAGYSLESILTPGTLFSAARRAVVARALTRQGDANHG